MLRFEGIRVGEVTFAPFGNDPVLLDQVTLTNRTRSRKRLAWFEYWDVNPFDQQAGVSGNIGLGVPAWNARTATLSVAQRDAAWGDRKPRSVFAAALAGPVAGHETSVSRFFGRGTRARPAEVVADHLSNSIAPASPARTPGSTLFAFRAPVSLGPGQSITLRYVYGLAHPRQIAPLVERYRSQRDPFGRSERAWARWLPQASWSPLPVGRARA